MPMGITLFQGISLGLTALGIGVSAATAPKQQQPRETEQEKQIRRVSDAHRAIAQARMRDQDMNVGRVALRLLQSPPRNSGPIADPRSELFSNQGV